MSPRTEQDTFSLPTTEQGNFYRHMDGGCYQVISRGKETESGVKMVAYIHRYPFEPTRSFRTAENFDATVNGRRRFAPITTEEAVAMMSIDCATAQKTVTAARAARRAAQQPNPRPF